MKQMYWPERYFFKPLMLLFALGMMLHSVQAQQSATVQSTFDRQGHRGCRGLMPENTIPAFLYALNLGVTTLEMDIVFTQDGVALVSHEPFFNHEITTQRNGAFIDSAAERQFNIYQMSYAATQSFDVGLKPHPRFPEQEKIAVHKPSLQSVFEAVQEYMKRSRRPFPHFNIETKTQPATDHIFHPEPSVFVDSLMQVIQQFQLETYCTIQSFDIRTLQYLHQHYPHQKTALLIEEDDTRSITAQLTELGFSPTIYSPHFSLLTPACIHELHEKSIQVIPWTVNEPHDMRRLLEWQVDGIITDYPNRLNEVLSERNQE